MQLAVPLVNKFYCNYICLTFVIGYHAQSVDRAYRIGQTRDVLVYRLISCGTVEEKIYRKQVFKGGLSRTGTEEGVQTRCGQLVGAKIISARTEES